MSPATVTCFEPTARIHGLDRLAVLASFSDSGADYWPEIDAEVQDRLGLLDKNVRGQKADVRVRKGRTQGEQFFLFTYRTYSTPDENLDPVVAGVTFGVAEGAVSIEADISGERTGDVILSLPTKIVPKVRDAVIEAACDLASELSRSSDLIVAGLNNASRRIE
jgi:hypothetical protein